MELCLGLFQMNSTKRKSCSPSKNVYLMKLTDHWKCSVTFWKRLEVCFWKTMWTCLHMLYSLFLLFILLHPSTVSLKWGSLTWKIIQLSALCGIQKSNKSISLKVLILFELHLHGSVHVKNKIKETKKTVTIDCHWTLRVLCSILVVPRTAIFWTKISEFSF